jgi:hypothetical protein
MITKEQFEELGLVTFADLYGDDWRGKYNEDLYNKNSLIEYGSTEIDKFDLIMHAKERGWDICYSTLNGYLVVWYHRSLKFQGYIKTIEDFKQLISWLRIDKFIR